MKEIKIDYNLGLNLIDLSEIVDTLQSSGVIVFPTETIYGLGANAFNDKAILRIFDIKKRDRGKPVSILVRDMQMARRVACIDSRAEKILSRLWPGPVTVVLRKKDAVSYNLTGDGENIAVRISSHPFVAKLFEKIDFPITATSANLAGKEIFLSVSDIKKEFEEVSSSPEIFINDGNLSDRTPSTIIDLTDINNPKIVRMGVVEKKEFEELFRKITDQSL